MAHIPRLHVALFLALLLASLAQAQQVPAPADPAPAEHRCWKFGAELDLVPYVFNGYYASGFAGPGPWRVRAIAARSDSPSFLISTGFENNRTDAYAVIFDRFLGKNRNDLRGFWIGGGSEFWRNRIRQKGTTPYTYFSNGALTAGGGYVWRVSRYFYVNPWSDLNFTVAGNRKINVSGKTYQQPVITPELSLKFGVVF